MTLQQELPDHISYAHVVTAATTYHAYTVQHVGDTVTVHVNGDPITLIEVDISGNVQGWRIAGINAAGLPEVWNLRRLSCGCNRSISTTRDEEIPA